MFIIPANVIVTVFPYEVKLSFLLLIPIALIEALIIRLILKKSWKLCLIGSCIANFLSALAGGVLIPAEFLFHQILMFRIVIIGILGFFSLYFFAYYLSVKVESWYYAKNWKDLKYSKIRNTVIIANLVTYIPIIIAAEHIGYSRRMERPFRMSCASNLKQIGLSLQQYAADYGGYYPDRDRAAGLVAQTFLSAADIYAGKNTGVTWGVISRAVIPGRQGNKGRAVRGGEPACYSAPMGRHYGDATRIPGVVTPRYTPALLRSASFTGH